MPMTTMAHDVADLALADEGQRLINWAAKEMPVLALIRERCAHDRASNDRPPADRAHFRNYS